MPHHIFEKISYFLLFTILASTPLTANLQLEACIDLDTLAVDYILETKRIHIPGYPNAFNPGIIRWHDSLLLSFRNIPNPLLSFNSNIGLIWLDEEFNPIGEPQLLETATPHTTIPSRAEDARLILIDDRLWMVYSDCKDVFVSKGGFRVYLGEITYDGKRFNLSNIEGLTQYEGESKSIREKNWVPFNYNETMLLAYSHIPHLIFKPIIGTGTCETIVSTTPEINWEWGLIRGSTPGLIIDDKYLAFFHSQIDLITTQSNEKKKAHYFMGAYTFNTSPPFEITHISPTPILGKGFYDGNIYKPYWKPVNVVFPEGFVFNDDYIWVSFGKHDHEAWIMKLDRKKLLDSLIPVQTSYD